MTPMTAHPNPRPPTASWRDIPLALCSFCFFKAVKLILTQSVKLQAARFNRGGYRWSILTGETVKSPLTLAVLLTKGPRWNPHAVIGAAGPFRVTHSLALNRLQADASSGSWTVVIYRYPGLKTVACLASSGAAADGEWEAQSLPPGRYSLGLRYYDVAGPVVFPTVRVDGQEALPARSAPPDPNGFYQDLHRRANWFYTALHYYVYPMLQWEARLPAAFVRSEYVPVGDPGNLFYYGPLSAGQALECLLPEGVLDHYRVYYTQYNRSSLPVSWSEIRVGFHRTPPASAAGFYLLRLRARGPAAAPAQPPVIHLRACGGAPVQPEEAHAN